MIVKKKNIKFAKGKVSLERALSKLGFASRTQTLELLKENRVKVNGSIKNNPKALVNPDKDIIQVDGKQVIKSDIVVLLLNKPRGLVTTRSDEKGRPTVFSLIKESHPHLHSVGRLDMASSGLLLLTNSTKLSSYLTNPENEISRVYVVSVSGLVTELEINSMLSGLRLQGELLKASEITLKKVSKKESQLLVTLKQGKNREIRRLFAHFDHEVTELKRISFGSVNLGDLMSGKYRKLSKEEIDKVFPACYNESSK